MEIAKDLLILLGRIITIFPLLIFITLMMGKRSIGELPVFDFLVIITLGAVVGADIADMDISHIHTVAAIVFIGIVQILVSKWKISNRTIGRLLTFEPTIVVRNGTFLVENMRNIRFSIDNILQMLRENDIFDISDVDMAIVEPNGRLTVQKKPTKSNVTIEDMGIAKVSPGISYPVIIEGKMYKEVLEKLQLDEDWLEQELKKLRITDINTVFFASVNEKKMLHVSLKETNTDLLQSTPPIFH